MWLQLTLLLCVIFGCGWGLESGPMFRITQGDSGEGRLHQRLGFSDVDQNWGVCEDVREHLSVENLSRTTNLLVLRGVSDREIGRFLDSTPFHFLVDLEGDAYWHESKEEPLSSGTVSIEGPTFSNLLIGVIVNSKGVEDWESTMQKRSISSVQVEALRGILALFPVQLQVAEAWQLGVDRPYPPELANVKDVSKELGLDVYEEPSSSSDEEPGI